MKRVQLTTAVVFGMLCTPIFADNGAVKIEFDFPISAYVPCLNESVSGTIYVTATYHEFETPSGTYHLIDNWKFRQVLVGDSTLREWIGKGVSPAGGNVTKNGEKFFYTDKSQLTPVHVDGIEDGPKWRYNLVFQGRWDEDGMLTKEFFNFASGDYRCLGGK